MEDYENLPKFERMINPKNGKTAFQQRKGRKKGIKKYKYEPSFMEGKISEYLLDKKIRFITEKKFPDLVSPVNNYTLLPLDFYMPELSLVIEYDGRHHFHFKDGDDRDALDRRFINDKARDLFCLKRGFKMLRISYKEAHEYKSMIDKAILEALKAKNIN